MRGRHQGRRSSSSGRRNQGKSKNSKGIGSTGSRGRSGGIVEHSPDNTSNQNQNQILNLNIKMVEKKAKSTKYGSHSPQSRTQKSQKSSRLNDGSSNSRGTKGKLRNKHSYHLNQPPQLSNQILMNYSQTQKFDLRDLNQQLLAHNSNFISKGGGSTQNKQVMLNQNSSNFNSMQSQKDQLRDKQSTGSPKSLQGQTTQNNAHLQGGSKPMQHQQFVFKPKNVATAPKYNNLLMASNKNQFQPPRGSSHNQFPKGEGGMHSPKHSDLHPTFTEQAKVHRSSKGGKQQVSSARSGGGSTQAQNLGNHSSRNTVSHGGTMNPAMMASKQAKLKACIDGGP